MSEYIAETITSHLICRKCGRLLRLVGKEEIWFPAYVTYLIWRCDDCLNTIMTEEG